MDKTQGKLFEYYQNNGDEEALNKLKELPWIIENKKESTLAKVEMIELFVINIVQGVLKEYIILTLRPTSSLIV